MRIVFLGTPDFAVPILETLINSKHDIVAVVTNPDRPSGRGNKIMSSPVKECALKNNLKVLQYEKIRMEGVSDLKELNADIMITASFGQILSQEILDICKFGVINVHASLLPKYRGASPIQQSILNGDKETGLTIMQTEIGIDTGAILLQKTVSIDEDETAGELFEKLSKLGGPLVIDVLEKIENDCIQSIKQDDKFATHTKMIKKTDGILDFSQSSKQIHDKIRAFNPFPITYFSYKNENVKVYDSYIINEEINFEDGNKSSLKENFEPGTILVCDMKNGLIVACGEGKIRLKTLQRAGAKRLPDTEFLKGFNIQKGDIIGKQ